MEQLDLLKKQLLIDAHDDDSGLWWVIGTVSNILELKHTKEIRQKTIQIITPRRARTDFIPDIFSKNLI